ncbi:uncharacterized protein LOC126823851 [Patella vulgata]|uniref:uncharacterized protein LOC126823851 n=1 Tax=Patella vulgata TaxID=6465 RepID=UPI00217FD465|nr:uncharacterized protein LOC126823851 [Patella vulgata]
MMSTKIRCQRLQFGFLILTCMIPNGVFSTCRFPEFLQREQPWAADYGEGRFVAYVKNTYMQINQLKGGNDSTYARRCIEETKGNKYLVTHEESLKPPKYMCMEFLQRSENIVQLKVSRQSDRRSIELCDESGMGLDHWPIVQIAQSPEQRIVCPFVGGYNINMYFPNETMVCVDNLLLMRMESECESGEGLTFDFRTDKCIPANLPREIKQRAYCIAHWTEEGHTFIVLQHSTVHKHFWCLRITDALGDIRTAYLFLNLVCDPSEPVLQTLNYFHFRMSRVIYSTICADELDGCSIIQSFCLTDFRRHCSKTCDSCEYESELGLCTFPEHLRGNWIESSRQNNRRMSVKEYSLGLQNIGKFECLNIESESYADKRILLELFDNGCYPRYACVDLEKIAPSVIIYRLGNRIDWPLPYRENDKDYLCKADKFKDRNTKYAKERPPKILIHADVLHPVSCGLPAKLQYGISFKEDGKLCGGCLYYSPYNDADKIYIQPVNCSVDPYPLEYNCLASFDFGNRTHAVVTKTSIPGNYGEYLCWVFTMDKKIKVIKSADCYEFENEFADPEGLEAQFSIMDVAEESPNNLCRNLVFAPRTTSARHVSNGTTIMPKVLYTILEPEKPNAQTEHSSEMDAKAVYDHRNLGHALQSNVLTTKIILLIALIILVART